MLTEKAALAVGGLAVTGVLLYLATRKEIDIVATIELSIDGDPQELVEGEIYKVRVAVTNQSTSEGEPSGATLYISFGASTEYDSVLVFPQMVDKVSFSAGQLKVLDYDLIIPVGIGGYLLGILARVEDKEGRVFAYVTKKIFVVKTTEEPPEVPPEEPPEEWLRLLPNVYDIPLPPEYQVPGLPHTVGELWQAWIWRRTQRTFCALDYWGTWILQPYMAYPDMFYQEAKVLQQQCEAAQEE